MANHILEISVEHGYYVFDYKQTSYTLIFEGGEWVLSSSRKSLHLHVPSYRFFKTLKDIGKEIKGLVGLEFLIGENDGTI